MLLSNNNVNNFILRLVFMLLLSYDIQAACEYLGNLKLSNTTITAQSVPVGSFTAPDGKVYDVPSFCRVHGVSKPTNNSHINFEVWMPASDWNGRYYQLGNGGFAGSISYGEMAGNLNQGNVVSATDNGHEANALDASWALNHPEKIVDFGYRSLKVTTDKAKALINAYYGRKPHYSYFVGCSDGGREALMVAQRFPEDWNGILVGAPANYWTRQFTGFAWNQKALRANPYSYIFPGKLAAIQRAALSSCDANAHLVGGIASDPRFCRYDPSVLICQGRETDECLTKEQVRALKKIYSGPRDPQTGEKIFPGYEPTMESETQKSDGSWTGGWRQWITHKNPAEAAQFIFANEFFSNMVFDNPDWDIRTHSAKNDYEFTITKSIAGETMTSILNADSPNLGALEKRDGKILMYFGWGDASNPPQAGIDYYESVKNQMGVQRTHNFYRLFMVPGMAHCVGGPGPNSFGAFHTFPDGIPEPLKEDVDHNIIRALEAWVENGIAPEKIIATKFIDDDPSQGVKLTRPLCPYPKIAVYKGVGDITKEASFICREGVPPTVAANKK